MVAVALVEPFSNRLSAGNLIQNTHTQEENRRKHFENCMSELADT